jgi:hypothetical protein
LANCGGDNSINIFIFADNFLLVLKFRLRFLCTRADIQCYYFASYPARQKGSEIQWNVEAELVKIIVTLHVSKYFAAIESSDALDAIIW